MIMIMIIIELVVASSSRIWYKLLGLGWSVLVVWSMEVSAIVNSTREVEESIVCIKMLDATENEDEEEY